MKTIESEEFYNLMQQYRCMPGYMVDGTLAAYQAVLDYINNYVQAQVRADDKNS